MIDNSNSIEIDVSSSEINILENGQGANFRYLLGYLHGEFRKLKTTGEIFVTIYFKRNVDMQWEGETFQLNPGELIFKANIPPGILASAFFVRIFGYIDGEFELTSLKVATKQIPIGKFGGNSLILLEPDQEPLPPNQVEFQPFEIRIPAIGQLTANTATCTWATTHRATSRVVYGFSPETMTYEMKGKDEDVDYYHEIMLIDLELEETYYAKFYSISELTGIEISSDVIQFQTTKEVTIQTLFSGIVFESEAKQKITLQTVNLINDTEFYSTLEPDVEMEIINDLGFSLHNKIELNVDNIIGTEFTYSVSP